MRERLEQRKSQEKSYWGQEDGSGSGVPCRPLGTLPLPPLSEMGSHPKVLGQRVDDLSIVLKKITQEAERRIDHRGQAGRQSDWLGAQGRDPHETCERWSHFR